MERETGTLIKEVDQDSFFSVSVFGPFIGLLVCFCHSVVYGINVLVA